MQHLRYTLFVSFVKVLYAEIIQHRNLRVEMAFSLCCNEHMLNTCMLNKPFHLKSNVINAYHIMVYIIYGNVEFLRKTYRTMQAHSFNFPKRNKFVLLIR